MADQNDPTRRIRLDRTLSQSQLVLYGIGTTVGAGIYALIGEIARVTGYLAPTAFLVAATLALFSAVTFANLSKRYPKAAGIALYIQQGFNSQRLARVAGLLAIAAGLISSAALLNGFVGYAQEFVNLSDATLITAATVVLCIVACWGIGESVWLAALITVIEVGALLLIAGLALWTVALADDAPALENFVPAMAWADAIVVLTGAVLAFYAYIGFEDMIEVAEEVVAVRHTLPKAILLTLGFTTALYLTLITAATLAAGPELLAQSKAPLSDLTRHLTGSSPQLISAVGMLAIINGVLIQIIMASRVMYGLASRAQLPAWLGQVNRHTQTPLNATLTASMIVILIALQGQLAELAKLTSVVILILFGAANLALLKLLGGETSPHYWLRVNCGLGAVICICLIGMTVYGWVFPSMSVP